MLRIKRGDTLSLAFAAKTDEGTVQDLTGYAVTSQVRAPQGALVADLDVVIVDAVAGELTLGATAAATAAWPLGKLICDLRLDLAGDVVHSETFEVIVIEAVTR